MFFELLNLASVLSDITEGGGVYDHAARPPTGNQHFGLLYAVQSMIQTYTGELKEAHLIKVSQK